MRRLLAFAIAICCVGHLDEAVAEERVALLIGNAAYEHTGALANPLNDVDAMETRLMRLGFAVQRASDAGRVAMERALYEFSKKAREADTALIFFSGHGMEIDGANYLIPVDAALKHPDDARFEAVPVKDAIEATRGTKRLSLVILDACRDNRFASTTRNTKRSFRPVASARAGQVIAYSTAAGEVAYDGEGALSPYTQALTEALDADPDRDVRLLFTSLGARVSELADASQEPYARFGRFPLEEVTIRGASLAATALSRAQIEDAQIQLRRLGFPISDEPGQFGPQTTRAVKAFQNRVRAEETGLFDRRTTQSLSAASAFASNDDSSEGHSIFRTLPSVSPGVLSVGGEDEDELFARRSCRDIDPSAATAEKYPFMVSLRLQNGGVCAAALLERDIVLTAGHCLMPSPLQPGCVSAGPGRCNPTPPDTVIVRPIDDAGRVGTGEFAAAATAVHPSFRYPTGAASEQAIEPSLDANVGLILLETPVKTGAPLAILDVAGDGLVDDHLFEAGRCGRLAAWGRRDVLDSNLRVISRGVESDKLQELRLPIVKHSKCEARYGDQITQGMICAGDGVEGFNTCSGDGGAPLIVDTKEGPAAVAVVSWAYGCAQADHYTIFQSLSDPAVRRWIEETVADFRYPESEEP